MRFEAALSENLTCDKRPGVGRKMLWPDKIVAPLPKGTLARIDATRLDGESKTDFLRKAVEAELRKREKPSKG
jgi:hypothetical protein